MDIAPNVIVAFFAGLIGGLASWRIAERKIEIENITQERAKWRARIQKMSLAVHQSSCSGNAVRLGELVTEFSINTNPFYDDDKAISIVVYKLALAQEKQEMEALLLEFRERISLLLKHDWERAKYETLSWFKRLTTYCLIPPARVSYLEYRSGSIIAPLKEQKLRKENIIYNFILEIFLGTFSFYILWLSYGISTKFFNELTSLILTNVLFYYYLILALSGIAILLFVHHKKIEYQSIVYQNSPYVFKLLFDFIGTFKSVYLITGGLAVGLLLFGLVVLPATLSLLISSLLLVLFIAASCLLCSWIDDADRLKYTNQPGNAT